MRKILSPKYLFLLTMLSTSYALASTSSTIHTFQVLNSTQDNLSLTANSVNDGTIQITDISANGSTSPIVIDANNTNNGLHVNGFFTYQIPDHPEAGYCTITYNNMFNEGTQAWHWTAYYTADFTNSTPNHLCCTISPDGNTLSFNLSSALCT